MPLSASQWIAAHGSRLRTISAWRLRQGCQRRDGECTWCGGKLSGRQTAWCSRLCVDAFLQLQPRHMRSAIHARDHGRCRTCKRDCDRMLYLSRRLLGLAARDSRWAPAIQTLRDHWASIGFHLSRAFSGEHYWEANHIVPVCQGGGLRGPDNYETLCIPCHAAVTRKMHNERRAQRTARNKQNKVKRKGSHVNRRRSKQ